MINILKKYSLFLLTIFSLNSCFLINPIEVPSVVVTVSDLQDFTATITWPAITDTRLGTIRYDVYVNNTLVASNLTNNSYTFNGLSSETSYTGQVIGKSSNYGNADPSPFSFTTKKEYIIISDPNFESSLIRQNIDTEQIQNGKMFKEDAEKLIYLDISNASISNLNGIQSFPKLEFLNCSNNLLTSVSLDNNINLKELYINNNRLTTINLGPNSRLITLDLSKNLLANLSISSLVNLENLKFNENNIASISFTNQTKLKSLACEKNRITNLNLSPNTSLVELNADFNLINSLNITQNFLLKTLSINNNVLTSLSINSLVNLEILNCSFNNLNNLNVNSNVNLRSLGCKNNLLTSLNLKLNPVLEIMNCQNNPNLRTVCVSNIATATNNLEWIIDPTTTYSLCN